MKCRTPMALLLAIAMLPTAMSYAFAQAQKKQKPQNEIWCVSVTGNVHCKFNSLKQCQENRANPAHNCFPLPPQKQ